MASRTMFVAFVLAMTPSVHAQDMVIDSSAVPKDGSSGTSASSSNFDIDVTNGECKSAFKDLCGTVTPGQSRAAECLRSKDRASTNRFKPVIGKACRDELSDFFVQAAKIPTNYKPSLVKACSTELQGICAGENWALSCLRKNKSKLNKKCKDEVYPEQVKAAEDIRTDIKLWQDCQSEIKTTCKDIQPGEGRVKDCLLKENRKKANQLSPQCKGSLFQTRKEISEDIRLKVQTKNVCDPMIEKFCSNVQPGENRIQSCLYDKRRKTGFDTACRTEIEGQVSSDSRDYRLNFGLKNKCKNDIESLCADEKAVVDTKSTSSGDVQSCLKKNMRKIQSFSCKMEVMRTVAIHAEHFKANKKTEDACTADKDRFCADTKNNKIQQCLREHLQDLSTPCRAQEFKGLKVESEDIHMKPLMKSKCATAIDKFCSKVEHGDAQVIDCLIEHKDDEEMDAKCATEIQKDEELTATDWRLKYGITHQCSEDIDTFCKTEKDSKGENGEGAPGVVLQCMVKNRFKRLKDQCKVEVRKIQREQAENIKNNPAALVACASDATTFCANVQPGHGALHSCLQSNLKKLSQPCKAAEFEQMKQKQESVELDPLLERACRSTIKSKCSDVKDEAGAIVRCLEDHKDDKGVPASCKTAIVGKEKVKNMDYRLNPQLQKDCTEDIDQLCSVEKQAAQSDELSGKVLDCLVKNRNKLKKPACKNSVGRKTVQRTENAAVDPDFNVKCKDDVNKFCKDVESGGGRIHNCLFENVQKLSKQCKEKEFDVQELKAEDVTLNPQMMRACKSISEKYCRYVPYGPDTIKCLIDHKDLSDVPRDCKLRLSQETIKQGQNIRFNAQMVACTVDLKRLKDTKKCVTVTNRTTTLAPDLQCLQNHLGSIKSMACKTAVRGMNKASSEDIRATPGNAGTAGPCNNDLKKFCDHDAWGNGRKNACLRSNYKQLEKPCKTLQTSIMSAEDEAWSVNPQLRMYCAVEKKTFCDNVPEGESRVLTCLKLRQNNPSFSTLCKDELQKRKVNVQATEKQVEATEAKLEAEALVDGGIGAQKSSIEISGTLALAAIAALVLVVGLGVYNLLKRSSEKSKGYTVVIPKT